MSQGSTITRLLVRWSDGDQDAAQALFDRYAHRLAALAEKNLSNRLAARVDGEDIVQSVFRTFFSRTARGEFRINDSVEIWQLLVTITLAKVRSAARRHTTGKRNIEAEVRGTIHEWLPHAMETEPGPAEAAALVEEIEAILSGLPDEYASILSLRLEGYSQSEIADQIGVTRQTVARALKRLQIKLQRGLPALADR